jgi:hypothetical protein
MGFESGFHSVTAPRQPTKEGKKKNPPVFFFPFRVGFRFREDIEFITKKPTVFCSKPEKFSGGFCVLNLLDILFI